MKCGIKISRFIDRTNSRTKIVNRLINLSSFIYTVENINTFPEINNTTHENIIPIESATTENVIGVLNIDAIFHSNKTGCCDITIKMVGIAIMAKIKNTMLLENLEILNFGLIMNKDIHYIFETTIQWFA